MDVTVGMYVDDNPHAGGHAIDVAECALIDRVLIHGTEQARSIAGEMEKAKFVEDWDAVVADGNVPALIVLTNNRDAGRLTLQGARAGKYVYGEKPGARTVEEMEQIVEACRETGAHFTPCYVRRIFPETRRIRRLLADGAIGALWSFQANWITSQATLRGLAHWLFDGDLAGGGILYWLGCHWIDLIRFVTGERIVAVSAMTRTADERIDVEDVACLNVRLEGGAIGTLRCGFMLNPYEGYEDYQLMTAWEGSHGSLSYFPHGPGTLRLHTRAEGFGGTKEAQKIAIDQTRAGGYALELLRDFVGAVEQNRPPMVTEEDALYVLEVAEAAYEASRTGREQALEP